MDAVSFAPVSPRIDDPLRAETQARRIEGEGTLEATWQAWPALARWPLRSSNALMPEGRRVVVVAPHPDDELLGCGGTLASLARAGREIVVVGVTDGEASHPGSNRYTPHALARTRCAERQRGLGALGVHDASVRLGFPDGGIAASEGELQQALQSLLHANDIVLTTWRLDGHPDHEAVARAAAGAARANRCLLHEMPIWMWHWAVPDDFRVPWKRLVRIPLDDAAFEAKRLAIAEHASQLLPDGDRGAVLPDWALARLQRRFEYWFVEGES